MKSKTKAKAEDRFLAGGGEMAERIRTFDWSATPLGPIERWPQSLKTSVSLMLNSQHPMWIGWGPQASFLYNDAYIGVLSLAKHPSVLGKRAAEVWAEIWDICGPIADKVFQKGEASFFNDVRLFMNRGDILEETFYSFSYSPIRDESGNVGGLFCPSAETTAKVLNARRLRTLSELASQSLIEKSGDSACASAMAILAENRDDVPFGLFYLIDAEGTSARLEHGFGLSADVRPVGPDRIDLTEAKTASGPWPLAEVFASQQARVVPVRGAEGFLPGAAGQRVSQALALPVVSRGHERIFGVLIAGVNPTRRLDADYRTFFDLVTGHVATAIQNARAIEQEKRRVDMLAELDRTKTTFFSNVSHELRTPLTLILGPLEDGLRKGSVPREGLELMHRNSLRLLKLVNTLLDFSRIEAGRVEASFEATDLAAFTADLAGVFRSGIERVGLALKVDCPALSEPVYVDCEMWEKIVFNLLSNALKFTPEGEIEIRLKETRRNGGHAPASHGVQLSVRDTGIGIPAREQPHVFERFRRIKNEWARTHEGTGIGLALVQELVRLHGGVVEVESSPGAGSTFSVFIPMGVAHLPNERVGARRSLTSTSVGALPFVEESSAWLANPASKLGVSPGRPEDTQVAAPGKTTTRARVVLADDNPDMREYVRRLLVDHGYDVYAVADGRAALEVARAELPALILCDVMMPRLDGFGLLRELREAPATRGIPVIMLSARAGEEARVEGVEAGANDYLAKPFSARELLARVASHIELARVRKEAADALHAATAKFRALFDQSSVFAGIMTLDGIVVEANRLCLDGCGYRAEDVLGKPFWDCGWWRGSKAVQDQIREGTAQAARGNPYVATLPYHLADGNERLVDFALHPIRNEAGEVIFLYPTGADVTERRQAQARADFLTQLTQQLSLVSDPEEINRIATREIGRHLSASRCYFFQAMPQGDRVRIMPDWHQDGLSSLAADYLLADFGPPEWWQAISRGVLRIEDVEMHPWTREFAAAYRAINIRSYAVAPFMHKGQWVASISVASDRPRLWTDAEKELMESLVARVWPLIERAQAGIALRTTQEALREANAQLADKAAHLEAVVRQRTTKLRETIGELESFSYSIAHDMRAPLRSLQGFSDILLEDYQACLDAEGQGYLRRIASSALRMDKLIQDVLNYSRVVRSDFSLEVVDVEQLLNGILETYPTLAREKADIVVARPLPRVLGNEAMLLQVFSNLLGNAVKFVSPGTRPRVNVSAETTEDDVRFYIADNGVGIAPDQFDKIFTIFQQVTKDFEGTGIGLAVVKKAVERMGGRIGLQSQLGQGTTFWIELRHADRQETAP